MHIASYLFAALLIPAPATAPAHLCTQYRTIYMVPCDDTKKHCSAGNDTLAANYDKAFQENKATFEQWATWFGTGGVCGGVCTVVYKSSRPEYTGLTYAMNCFVARLRRKVTEPWPNMTGGIERASEDRQCNVYCDTVRKGQSCNFVYGHC
ncbi:hypothetical protein FKW77_001170 [Venturia effusa]|uniref:Secreted protein n=1 Tax=Venturia effusa TaxID=50376 RepID=A0A517L0R1_9PEZI|nr:hypothetical protein FKW77_001170 [Venturia effusa]